MKNPKQINSTVKMFGQKIIKSGIAKISFVPVSVANFSIVNECYDSVDKQIKKNGGKIIYGWSICDEAHDTEGVLFLEAEAHAIWESDNKKRLCISPNNQKEKNILFLEDSNNYILNNRPIPNYRMKINKNIPLSLLKILEIKDFLRIKLQKIFPFKNVFIAIEFNKYNQEIKLKVNNTSYILNPVDIGYKECFYLLKIDDILNKRGINFDNECSNLINQLNYRPVYTF